jgi:hypothetical protein
MKGLFQGNLACGDCTMSLIRAKVLEQHVMKCTNRNCKSFGKYFDIPVFNLKNDDAIERIKSHLGV